MPFARDDLTDLRQQAMQDVSNALPGANGFLRRSPFRVLAYVVAGLAYLLYGFLDWIAKQAVPFTAEGEYAQGWGNLVGVVLENPTYASGTVSFPAPSANGQIIGEGVFIIRADGALYVSTTEITVSGGAAVFTVTAVDAGADANCDADVQLFLQTPIENVQSTGVVQAPGIDGGADVETADHYRTRYLKQYANPPQGGALTDYEEWALAVPGVTRAWAVRGADPGTVVVYFMMDTVEAANNGFPQGTNGTASSETRDTPATGDQLILANALYAPSKRPVTALVYAWAPTAQPVNYTIGGLAGNTALQQAVLAALQSMHLALDIPGGTLEPSDWYGAVNMVPNIPEFTVPVPAAPVTAAAGALLTVGTVIWA